MTVSQALFGVTRLFLDTAPVIYFVEQNPAYAQRINKIFDLIELGNGPIIAASAITLAETLVIPCRLSMVQLQRDFNDLLAHNPDAIFMSLGPSEAQSAARIRARYNLSLTDSFQISCAIAAGCEALLTNDHQFRQVTEVRTIILDALTQ